MGIRILGLRSRVMKDMKDIKEITDKETGKTSNNENSAIEFRIT